MPAAEESHGINRAVDKICSLPPYVFTETSQHILTYFRGQTSGVDSAEIDLRLQRAGVIIDHEAVQGITRFLLLTFRSAGKNNFSADELVSKLEEGSSKWSKASLQILHTLWSEHGASVRAQQEVQSMLSIGQILHTLWSEHGASVRAQQEVQSMLSIGQLVDMQWKLGMAVSSDTCRSLNSPYVSLLLKIVEPSGQICQRAFEMTIPQFQNFHKQFKEMAAIMETV